MAMRTSHCVVEIAVPFVNAMDSMTVLAIFLLGASVGSLITMIRYQGELGRGVVTISLSGFYYADNGQHKPRWKTT